MVLIFRRNSLQMSLLNPKAFILLRKVLIVGNNKQIKTCDSCGISIKSRTPGMICVTVKQKTVKTRIELECNRIVRKK